MSAACELPDLEIRRDERDHVLARVGGIYAKVMADSINVSGQRITTLEVRFPRIILAEVNTHRMVAKNGASSRAIPFTKRLAAIQDDPFIPMRWGREQKGMEAGEEVEHPEAVREIWLKARDEAVEHAIGLASGGLHKNLCNRLIEPFAWMTMVWTATNYANLTFQRDHRAAEDHFQILGACVRSALISSGPSPLHFGEWHMPYIRPDDYQAVWSMAHEQEPIRQDYLRKISAARCARVSYETQDGVRDVLADLGLFSRLVVRDEYETEPGHWSPLEHVCMALATPERIGPFTGWFPLRKQYKHEYRREEWE